MCGYSDYFETSNQCLYNEKPGMRPFFKTIGRVVYYNLPKNQSLFIHCFDETLNIPEAESEMKLKNTTGNITSMIIMAARDVTSITSRKSDINYIPSKKT
jgi:hypothetical protein